MKKIFYIVLVLSLFASCSPIKYYHLIRDDDDVKIYKKKVAEIDLDYYDVYKREVYFKEINGTIYKGYEQPDKSYERYEAQFFLVEKGNEEQKRIIYFSYIPPYRYKGINYNLDRKVFNENYNLVNMHLINYIYFGKLYYNKIVELNKEKSLSSWKIEFNADHTEICINALTFLDRGKVKTVNSSVVFGSLPIYKKIDKPLIVLHYDTDASISNECTDYFLDQCIYYDLQDKCVYIRFDDYLEDKDKEQVHRWIKYDCDRIKSSYED